MTYIVIALSFPFQFTLATRKIMEDATTGASKPKLLSNARVGKASSFKRTTKLVPGVSYFIGIKFRGDKLSQTSRAKIKFRGWKYLAYFLIFMPLCAVFWLIFREWTRNSEVRSLSIPRVPLSHLCACCIFSSSLRHPNERRMCSNLSQGWQQVQLFLCCAHVHTRGRWHVLRKR